MGCVKVLYFAGLVDITKVDSEMLKLDNNDENLWTVQYVVEILIKKYGAEFAKIVDTCMFAVDMEYVLRSHPLPSTALELAILPPVSGG